MAEENNTVLDAQEPGGGTEGGTTPPATEPEKKYTDDDVNNISKKNSEKAINKLLKELGITDKEKAKKILARVFFVYLNIKLCTNKCSPQDIKHIVG